MPENNPSIPPYVRAKQGARIAGVGLTEFYNRLNKGRYQSFLDGNLRFVVTESILADQRKLAEEQSTPAGQPLGRGSGRRGRPRKTHT